jgi:hypothetical protein
VRKRQGLAGRIQSKDGLTAALIRYEQAGAATQIQQSLLAAGHRGAMFRYHFPHQVDSTLKPPMVVFQVEHAPVFDRFHCEAIAG